MLEDLKAFIAVVDNSSLTKAADKLHLTQSAVSRRVQQLEEALGATLLDRSSRPPSVTAVGRRVYHAGIFVLRDVDRLLSVPRDDEEPSGTFRIGLPQVIADVALFEISKRLKVSFPGLALRCSTDWSSTLQEAVATGDLDAAILMAPIGVEPLEGLASSPIARFDVLVVQSRSSPLVPMRPALAELADHEWVLNPEGCGYRALLQRAMEGVGKRLRVGIDVHGTETQLRLVAAGMGLGLAPRSLLAASDHREELSIVDVANLSLLFDLWLIHAKSLGNLTKALDVLHRALIDPVQPE